MQHHTVIMRHWPDRTGLRRTLAQVVREAISGVDAPVVWEFGCGEGEQTEFLLPVVGDAGRIVATDINPRMVAQIKRRFAGHDNLQARREDVFSPSERNVDVVVATWAIHNFSTEKRIALLENMDWKDIIRPGGTLVFMDKVLPDEPWKRARLWRKWCKVYTGIAQEKENAGRAILQHELRDWSPRCRMLEGETLKLLERVFRSKPVLHVRDDWDVVISVRYRRGNRIRDRLRRSRFTINAE